MEELKSIDTWRAVAAEFLATLLFVFFAVGTVVVTGMLTDGDMTLTRLAVIALGHGLAIVLLVAAFANISGANINPAVTFGIVIAREMSIPKGVAYIIAQIIGAIAGVLLVAAVVPDAINGALGSHSLADNISVGSAVLLEIILTFALVFVVFATAVFPRGPSLIAPVAIGLVVLVDHLIGIRLTGASMNPARSFGPALISGEWADHWVYWVGPLIGGALGALTFELMYIRGRKGRPM